MPTYEYRCERCDHEFERQQRITDKPIRRCPACRSRGAKRLISNTSFVLKGGGWYSDLYGSAGAKADKREKDAATRSGASASGGDAKGKGTSADAKPKSGSGDTGTSKGKTKSSAA